MLLSLARGGRGGLIKAIIDGEERVRENVCLAECIPLRRVLLNTHTHARTPSPECLNSQRGGWWDVFFQRLHNQSTVNYWRACSALAIFFGAAASGICSRVDNISSESVPETVLEVHND